MFSVASNSFDQSETFNSFCFGCQITESLCPTGDFHEAETVKKTNKIVWIQNVRV